MLSSAQNLRVIRRTFLYPHEKRTNFTPIDNDILLVVTSDEAAKVTDKMSKIYLRLLRIKRDSPFCQGEGVVCFPGEERQGVWISGFDQMVEYLGVAAATARKALDWMKQKGIIGYVCPKGYPTRLWLNRAASSIAVKPQETQQQTSAVVSDSARGIFFMPGTVVAPTFKEVTVHGDHCGGNIQTAPSGGVNTSSASAFLPQTPAPVAPEKLVLSNHGIPKEGSGILREMEAGVLEEIRKIITRVSGIERKISSVLPDCAAAVRAEVDDQLEFQFRKMRQFLQDKAIPQAARVGQQEAYKILRRNGNTPSVPQNKADLYVGAGNCLPVTAAQISSHLSPEEAMELAEMIWIENAKTSDPIERTLETFMWKWEAGQKFNADELSLLRKTVQGREVQEKLQQRKLLYERIMAELEIASPPPAEAWQSGRNIDAERGQ